MSTIDPAATDGEIMTELGNRLRSLRKLRRLEIQVVAEQTGLSRRTVYRAELGDNPTLATLLRLIRLYGNVGDLDSILRPPEVSPMALLEAAKRPRRRSPPRRRPGDSPSGASAPRGSGNDPPPPRSSTEPRKPKPNGPDEPGTEPPR